MRPSDDLAEARVHPFDIHVDAAFAQLRAELDVPLVPVAVHPVQHLLQRGGGGVDVIAEDVHRAAELGADLDAGHDLDSAAETFLRRARIADGRVVVGDRHGRKSGSQGLLHDLLGREGPVGGGGVDMQVDLFHVVI